MIISRGNNERCIANRRVVVRPLLDDEIRIDGLALDQFVARARRANAYPGPAVEQRGHLTSRHGAAANDERDHRRAVEHQRKAERRTHRNFPAAGPATRIATYSTSTATKVMLEYTAARRACQPPRTRPTAIPLTATQAPVPHIS